MAYAFPFLRLTFGGTMATGQEIWSCNMHLANTNGGATTAGDFASVKSNLPAIGEALEAFVSDAKTNVPDDVTLDWVKVAFIGTTGEYLDESYEIDVEATGSQTSSYLPQGAMVNTLVSTKRKDPGKYNRFYMPFTLQGSFGQWKMDTVTQNDYVDTLETFIRAVNAILIAIDTSDSLLVAVVSNTNGQSAMPVTRVQVGQIVDTQRRRRNKLPEAYASRTVLD
uniref:Uncharacterized protein n=1 Tax=uncultured prokaryote TaxID=198431 RepID=A0A0H5Q5U0_9ZZZZ|nr:hypothetical protein [uncultured prokaryote]